MKWLQFCTENKNTYKRRGTLPGQERARMVGVTLIAQIGKIHTGLSSVTMCGCA